MDQLAMIRTTVYARPDHFHMGLGCQRKGLRKGRPTSVFNHTLLGHFVLDLVACLVSHLLSLLFNPPNVKESANVQ